MNTTIRMTVAVLALQAGVAAAQMAKVSGELTVDGRAPRVTEGACRTGKELLASVVFFEAEHGVAAKRVDLTCRGGMRFEAELAPGAYRAAVWPAAGASDLVTRPYEIDADLSLKAGRNVVTLDESTTRVVARLRGHCQGAAAVEFSDVELPFAQTVKAECIDGQLSVVARLPHGVYRVSYQLGGREHLVDAGLPVAQATQLVDLGEERGGEPRVARR